MPFGAYHACTEDAVNNAVRFIKEGGVDAVKLEGGVAVAEKMCGCAAKALGIEAGDVVVASTGVIGQPLDISPIEKGMKELADGLSPDGGKAAAEAIMTTDTKMKEAAVEFMLGGRTCRIGGMAKGSGMIHPNMATCLIFITTDAAISSEMLQKALKTDVQSTFNGFYKEVNRETQQWYTVTHPVPSPRPGAVSAAPCRRAACWEDGSTPRAGLACFL